MRKIRPVHLHDAHNHLQDDWLAPVLDRLGVTLPALGLRTAVVNGTCEEDWPAVATLAQRFPWVHASYGVHPWKAGHRSANWTDVLKTRLTAEPGAAIGEIGLDRWMLDRARPDDPRLAGLRRAPLDEQASVCTFQLQLAAEYDRPVTLHCLDAWGPLEDLLRSTRLPDRGFLLHAYGGSLEQARTFAGLGAYFSFNGAFLDPRKAARLEVFRNLPRDRLLVETDAPAMPLPQPWRTHKLKPAADGSTINHPGNIEAAYTGLAATLGLAVEDLAAQVDANFKRLFGRRSD